MPEGKLLKKLAIQSNNLLNYHTLKCTPTHGKAINVVYFTLVSLMEMTQNHCHKAKNLIMKKISEFIQSYLIRTYLKPLMSLLPKITMLLRVKYGLFVWEWCLINLSNDLYIPQIVFCKEINDLKKIKMSILKNTYLSDLTKV